MITRNSKSANVNNKRAFNFKYPNQISNLRTWLRSYDLGDFTLNFQTQTGTVSITNGSRIVTGVSTSFAAIDVGKRIRINGLDRWITAINSTTSVTVDSNFTTNTSGLAYSYGYVSSWLDRSVDVQNFSQGTATAQPFIYLVNNKIVVYFNQNRHTDFLISATKNLGLNQTYFFKATPLKAAGFGVDIFNSGDGEKPRICTNPSVDSAYQHVVYNTAPDLSRYYASVTLRLSNRNRVLCFVNNSNGWNIINEGNIDIGANANLGIATPQVINNTFILGNFSNQNSGNSFVGHIQEVVIFDKVLNSNERSMVLNYLNFL